ncbi:MAG: TIGR02530 family flagellar biosynthesis protein [Huintestinicola sp.]
MLISEYMQLRGVSSAENTKSSAAAESSAQQVSPENSPFAAELKARLAAQSGMVNVQPVTTAEQLEIMSGINFSRHAVDRINQRNIDVLSDDKLARLNKGVELAESKGSDDALVIVDKTAFVVSIRSNKVITAVNAEDMQGNVFTNIDSTVII